MVATIMSAGLLLGAHIFEWLGYAPCELCLDQREAHWTALGIAAAGLFAVWVIKAPIAAAAAVGAVALVYAVSTGLAFYHTGVEYHFWPGPQSCASSSAGLDVQAMAAALSEKVSPPSCDAPAWRMFGISMAGYNMLLSAGLFTLTFSAALGAARQSRHDRFLTH